MSEEDTTPETAAVAPEDDSITEAAEDTPLRPEGERALKRVKSERDELKARIAEFEKAQKEAEDAKLSEQERLQRSTEEYRTRAEQAESRLTRLEIAHRYGLTEGQAKRLVGTTSEELDADAQALLEELGQTTPRPADAVQPRAQARLRGGTVPEDDEPDPKGDDVAARLFSARYSFD